jgi:hypothetical protein
VSVQQAQVGSDNDWAGGSCEQQLQLGPAAVAGLTGGQQLQVAAASSSADGSGVGEQQPLWQAVFLGGVLTDIFLKAILFTSYPCLIGAILCASKEFSYHK